MALRTNPHIAGKPVGSSDIFVGRTDLMETVTDMLEKSRESALVIYGQRLSGKTSFLRALEGELARREAHVPLYFDLHGKAALPAAAVLRELAGKIARRLDTPLPENPEDGDFPMSFRNRLLPDLISRVPGDGALMLLLDEFDTPDTLEEGLARSTLFPFLRDLLSETGGKLGLVFMIGRRSDDFPALSVSALKNLKTCHIPLLSSRETSELIGSLEKNGEPEWPEQAAEQIHELTGGHPFLIRRLCHEIRARASENGGAVASQDIRAAISPTLKRAGRSMEWLWEGLRPSERVIMSVLARAETGYMGRQEIETYLREAGVRILIGELQDAPRTLEEWDMVSSREESYRIRIELVRQWVRRHKPLSDIQNELDRVLPVADKLFRTGRDLCEKGQFEDAGLMLQYAVSLNPNHLKAAKLLAEVLLAMQKTSDALKVLDTIYEYKPSEARPRLVQALLIQAKGDREDAERMEICERILALDPGQPEALSEHRHLCEKQGDAAFEKNELDKAMSAYEKAGAKEKIAKVARKFQLENLYQQASEAMKRGKEDKAKELLAEIIPMEPGYRSATRHLHRLVTGVDVAELEDRIIQLKAANRTLEQEKADLRTDIGVLKTEKLGLDRKIRDMENELLNARHRIGHLKKEKSKLQKIIAYLGSDDLDLILENDAEIESPGTPKPDRLLLDMEDLFETDGNAEPGPGAETPDFEDRTDFRRPDARDRDVPCPEPTPADAEIRTPAHAEPDADAGFHKKTGDSGTGPEFRIPKISARKPRKPGAPGKGEPKPEEGLPDVDFPYMKDLLDTDQEKTDQEKGVPEKSEEFSEYQDTLEFDVFVETDDDPTIEYEDETPVIGVTEELEALDMEPGELGEDKGEFDLDPILDAELMSRGGRGEEDFADMLDADIDELIESEKGFSRTHGDESDDFRLEVVESNDVGQPEDFDPGRDMELSLEVVEENDDGDLPDNLVVLDKIFGQDGEEGERADRPSPLPLVRSGIEGKAGTVELELGMDTEPDSDDDATGEDEDVFEFTRTIDMSQHPTLLFEEFLDKKFRLDEDVSGPRLAFLSGGKKDYEITKDSVSIGKNPNCDIVVGGLMVGQTAAIIDRRGEDFYLSYAGGRMAKVKINDETVKTEVRLKPFDVIEVGSVKMQFSLGDSPF